MAGAVGLKYSKLALQHDLVGEKILPDLDTDAASLSCVEISEADRGDCYWLSAPVLMG